MTVFGNAQDNLQDTQDTLDARLDVLCVGETLIDLIASGQDEPLAQAQFFQRTLGGSPANLATQVARLGGRSAVVSKVGADAFGAYCRDQLREAGVATDYLVMDPAARTTLVFLSRTGGTPDFEVFRGGDSQLRAREITPEALARARVAHLSSWPLAQEPSRDAALSLCAHARARGVALTLDPNYHPTIWPDRAEALAVLGELCPQLTLLKPSLDDARRLFGAGRAPEAYLDRFHALGAATVILTMGGDGVWLSTPKERTLLPTERAPVQNATGAGDTFWAAFLLAWLDGVSLVASVRFAQGVARRKLLGEDITMTTQARRARYA